MHTYHPIYYDYIEHGSLASAKRIVPIVYDLIKPQKVLDVGCGRGAWLSQWKKMNVQVVGIDGDYVQKDQLWIDPSEFVSADLTQPFDLKKPFDLVQSLEVAEHLPQDVSKSFVKCLCQHAPVVLFSAAVKGQGGEYHINEQSLEFWRALFKEQGYYPADVVRRKVVDHDDVEAWYKYNTILYVCQSHKADVSIDHYLTDREVLEDISPIWYKARKMILKPLPNSAIDLLAELKKKYIVSRWGPVKRFAQDDKS